MPKIIYVANTDWYLFNFRISLLKKMVEAGWQVIGAAPEGPYRKEIENIGVKFIPIILDRKGKNPFKELLSIWQLYKIYMNERPTLVHHFTIKPVIYGSIAARFVGDITVVNAITGLGYTLIRKGILRKFAESFYKYSMRKSACAIFQNRADLEYFLRRKLVDAEKAFLVEGSGVDVKKFSPVSSKSRSLERISFLMASRMLWDKGVREFIVAAENVTKRFRKSYFWLAGAIDSGNPTSVPEEWLVGKTSSDHIKWLGHQEDIKVLMAEADVIVLPSYREGLPKCLLEAAAMAKPIIATDIPGCREIVEDGINGILVPVGDSDKLEAAMIAMIEKDVSERERMGMIGRKRVLERFADNIILSKTFDIYRRIGFLIK